MGVYSGTPLWRKLGIKEDHRVALVFAPPGFRRQLGSAPTERIHEWRSAYDVPEKGDAGESSSGRWDVIVCFVTAERQLRESFRRLAAGLQPAGGLWVAWPKRSSRLASDLDFNNVQGIGLETGLVDNKSCAIDDDWSALRFVVRLSDRACWPELLSRDRP